MFTLTLVSVLAVLCAAPFAPSMHATNEFAEALALACADLHREMNRVGSVA